jgi:hypothetical protein
VGGGGVESRSTRHCLAVYSKNLEKRTTYIFGQDAEFLNVKAGSEDSHRSLQSSVSETAGTTFSPINDIVHSQWMGDSPASQPP